MALARSVTKGRNTLFSKLPTFIIDEKLLGLKRVMASGTSYYAAVFDTAERMKRAKGTLERAKFRVKEKEIPLTVEEFGARREPRKTVWVMSASALAEQGDVSKAIYAHLQKTQPVDWQSEVSVAKRLKREVSTGMWGVQFDIAPPIFQKQMEGLKGFWLISQEPPTVCRFCSTPGHNLFECSKGGDDTISAIHDTFEVTGTKPISD